MSNPEHEQVVRHGYAVAEAVDVPGFVNAFTPDGTFTDEAFGNVFTGSKELEGDDELPATIQPSDGLLNPGGSRRGRVSALTHGCVPHFRVRSCGIVMCQVCSTSMSTHANAPIHLPPPIATYFAADTSDAHAVARCFSQSAIVIDEWREHRGRPSIARWVDEAAAKYHYTSEPLAVDVAGLEVTVTARVTGDFPGSPEELP